jgi:hypothetical protein
LASPCCGFRGMRARSRRNLNQSRPRTRRLQSGDGNAQGRVGRQHAEVAVAMDVR